MSDYKDDFELHAETLLESAEVLLDDDVAYNTHLAAEMIFALEDSDVEQVRYKEVQEQLYD